MCKTLSVTIYWSAFSQTDSEVASVTIPVAGTYNTDLELLEDLFEQTNLYEGHLWDTLEPRMPDSRSHTALSVGDKVTIDGRAYICEHVGWMAQ